MNWPFPARNQLQSVIPDIPEHQWVMFTGPLRRSLFTVQNCYYQRFTGKPPPDTSLPPTHHALLRKAVLQCLIACREQCCLSCYLLSFPALAARSEDDNIIRENSKTTICHCKPHFQHLVVELGTEILCPSRVKQTWAESARLKFTRSKNGLLPISAISFIRWK